MMGFLPRPCVGSMVLVKVEIRRAALAISNHQNHSSIKNVNQGNGYSNLSYLENICALCDTESFKKFIKQSIFSKNFRTMPSEFEFHTQ